MVYVPEMCEREEHTQIYIFNISELNLAVLDVYQRCLKERQRRKRYVSSGTDKMGIL